MKFTGESDANRREVVDFLVTHRPDTARLQLRHATGTKTDELTLDGKAQTIPVIIFGNEPVAVVSVLIPGSNVEYDKATDTFVVTNP